MESPIKFIYLFLLFFLHSIYSTAQMNALKIQPYTFKSNSGKVVEAELGSFHVQENRTKNNGKQIELFFVRFKSTNPNPGNPIVYLAGGPGGSGINTAQGPRFELFMAMREVADVIAFDQRGTGRSNHIPPCQNSTRFPLTEPGSRPIYIEKMKETAKACLSFWKEQGVDIEAYNTYENADDLEDLRIALGAKKINLWGISYGSHLGFTFIKRHEKSIDKVVLTGLEGPDQTIKRPLYNQQFLEYLNLQMQDNPKAKKQYENLIALMQEVFAKLEDNPISVDFKDPRSGYSGKVAISKFDLQLVTSYFLLKNPEDSKKVPYLFKKMSMGDFTEVAPLVAILKQFAGQVRGMPFAMDAMSGISPERWELIQAEAKDALLGRTTNFPFPDITEGLDLQDLGKEFRVNPQSDLPCLFFSGTLDGRTYLPAAKELIKGFRNGIHIILEGAGHDLFMSTPKVRELMLAFYKGKKIKSQTIDIGLPDFVLMEKN